MKNVINFILVGMLSLGCNTNNNMLKNGTWRGVFDIGVAEVPFLFIVSEEGLYIVNGEENIMVDEIQFEKDSIIIRLPVYDTEIRAKCDGKTMNGYWYNYARVEKNVVPFTAVHGQINRFPNTRKPMVDFSGKWEVGFLTEDSSGAKKSNPGLGVFQQDGNELSGTILTTTGDYRFLEGVVDGDEVKLSSFNGASVYLFDGKINGDSLIGTYYSGIHHNQPWIGKKNDQFTLPDADTLTKQLSEISFAFPDLDGHPFQYPNKLLDGKVVILQLMGSWCPNCYDESILLNKWHKKYNSQGLEVIALAFENTDDFKKSQRLVERLKNRIEADYTFLIAGKSDKQTASQALPFLDKVMAFPTTVFIDRQGNVRKIHTGFSGPATGAAYHKFVTETTVLIEELL